MRRLCLLALVLLLSACQVVAPPLGGKPPSHAAGKAEIEQEVRDQVLQEVEATKEVMPETPLHPTDPAPSLHQWLNYQLHVASLTRKVQDALWQQLNALHPNLTSAQKLQFVVISLHYPPQRNLSRMHLMLADLREDDSLNEDSRRYARQLSLWVIHLLRWENETARLRQQLDEERALKQELEEKIKKLTYIEETLNQRQRDREP